MCLVEIAPGSKFKWKDMSICGTQKNVTLRFWKQFLKNLLDIWLCRTVPWFSLVGQPSLTLPHIFWALFVVDLKWTLVNRHFHIDFVLWHYFGILLLWFVYMCVPMWLHFDLVMLFVYRDSWGFFPWFCFRLRGLFSWTF